MKTFSVLSILILPLTLIVFVNGIYAASPESADLPHKNVEIKSHQDPPFLFGKVVETMNSGGYTYVNIEKDGNKTWVAVPPMKVVVGQEVAFQPGMVVTNFTSKTLNRTFETIIFSGGPVGKHGGQSMNAESPHHRQPDVPANMTIKVEKASEPNAYTVAELYEKSSGLDKKDVAVRGQVVKFSPNIMGKNWVHIQDGSGDPAKGTHDIVVTSQDRASVGDIVTAKGTLYKDKDFGTGYKYAAIVEQATIQK